jgi:hypothetical protein
MQWTGVLGRARELLNEGRPGDAMELIVRSRQASPALDNARAVCLLRLGKVDEALRVLRALLFPRGSICIDEDAPVVFRTNFVTALLMAGNVVAGTDVLGAIHESKHPAVLKLHGAIRQWKKGLSPWERFLYYLGKCPDKAVTLGFPPGDLWSPAEGPERVRAPA